jgi:hypothetical protein
MSVESQTCDASAEVMVLIEERLDTVTLSEVNKSLNVDTNSNSSHGTDLLLATASVVTESKSSSDDENISGSDDIKLEDNKDTKPKKTKTTKPKLSKEERDSIQQKFIDIIEGNTGLEIITQTFEGFRTTTNHNNIGIFVVSIIIDYIVKLQEDMEKPRFDSADYKLQEKKKSKSKKESSNNDTNKDKRKNIVTVNSIAKSAFGFIANRFISETYTLFTEKRFSSVEKCNKYIGEKFNEKNENFEENVKTYSLIYHILHATNNFKHLASNINMGLFINKFDEFRKTFRTTALTSLLLDVLASYFQILAHFIALNVWAGARTINMSIIETGMRNIELANENSKADMNIIINYMERFVNVLNDTSNKPKKVTKSKKSKVTPDDDENLNNLLDDNSSNESNKKSSKKQTKPNSKPLKKTVKSKMDEDDSDNASDNSANVEVDKSNNKSNNKSNSNLSKQVKKNTKVKQESESDTDESKSDSESSDSESDNVSNKKKPVVKKAIIKINSKLDSKSDSKLDSKLVNKNPVKQGPKKPVMKDSDESDNSDDSDDSETISESGSDSDSNKKTKQVKKQPVKQSPVKKQPAKRISKSSVNDSS